MSDSSDPETVNPQDDEVDLKKEMARLKKKLAQAEKKIKDFEEIKISDKGCVSLYGIRKQFPVSYYRAEWETILGKKKMILKFIEDNAEEIEEKERAEAERKERAKAAKA